MSGLFRGGPGHGEREDVRGMGGSVTSVRRVLIGLFAALIVGVIGALPAAACSCATLPIATHVENADLVVRGEVTGVENPAMGAENMALYTVTVTTVWKGPIVPDSRVVTVMSSANGASCGLEGIEEGADIVLFAQATDASNSKAIASWEANLCGGTGAASNLVPKVEAELGAGRTLAPTAGTVTATDKPTVQPVEVTPNSEGTADPTQAASGAPATTTLTAVLVSAAVVAGGVALILGGRSRRS